MKRHVCFITGSRAEYSLLQPLITKFKIDKSSQLSLLVTGSHLSNNFGNTYKQIIKDGIKINHKIDLLIKEGDVINVSNSLALAIKKFCKKLLVIKPDLIIVLGDRYEIFGAVSAALIANIPVAHIHGGELSEGAYDDAFRHCITKMSHLHFTSTNEYRKRVIQLGESPTRVFNVGSLGVDNLSNLKLLNKKEVEKQLKIKFSKKNLLITFHPITLDLLNSKNNIKELLFALDKLEDTTLLFTASNADTNGKMYLDIIKKFVKLKKNRHLFLSLGQLKYFSCALYVDGIIGNSSSGLIEIPTLKKGSINIGDRQKGRIKSSSVIDCKIDSKNISSAIKKIYTGKFINTLKNVKNPYKKNNTSNNIFKIIKNYNLYNINKKNFYNIKF